MIARGGGKVVVIAHRGSSGSAPENTMAAFRMAAEAGADMIELDVRMTEDNEVVVIHDRRVDRTTNGSGYVREKSLREIRTLDAGSWFNRRFKGERVPTLQEVLEDLPTALGVNIEVKSDGNFQRSTVLEQSCLEIIRSMKLQRQILLSSFDHRLLRRLQFSDPGIPTGALYVSVRDFAKTPWGIARRTGARAFICSCSQLRKRFVKNAHEHDIVVGTYGVNTLRDLAKVRRYGVDALVTDVPEKILRALRSNA